MNLPDKLHPAHPMTLCNSVCIEVKHASIRKKDISGVLKFARLFASTKENAWNIRGNVWLSFSGYCSDSRELYEIPEVRAYVKKLIAAWPEWMFFLDTSGDTLSVIVMCLVRTERTADPSQHRVVGGLLNVVIQGFEGINQLCAKYQFGDEVIDATSRKIATCLGLTQTEASVGGGDTLVIGGAE